MGFLVFPAVCESSSSPFVTIIILFLDPLGRSRSAQEAKEGVITLGQFDSKTKSLPLWPRAHQLFSD